jgi:alanine dehydrogenase
MQSPQTLVLSGQDIRAVLDFDACIQAVEHAFRLHGTGAAAPPHVFGVHVADGGFHIKAGVLDLERMYFAAKTNANFPANGVRHGLPTIQGVVLLFDARCGLLLAIMDAAEVTRLRTAAATAVAASHLSRPDAATITICGCGVQGEAHLEALARVRLPRHVFAVDADAARAARFAREQHARLGVPIETAPTLHQASQASDIVVTCTPSRRPILELEDVTPGTFVAAVGADHPEKQEIAANLMARATVVTDVTAQALSIGDLHHAVAQGLMRPEGVYAELGQIVAGNLPGRRTQDEIIVFDSTGMALQDVAAAALVYERAQSAGRGLLVELR